MTVRTALIDDLVINPDQPQKDWLIDVEIKVPLLVNIGLILPFATLHINYRVTGFERCKSVIGKNEFARSCTIHRQKSSS